MQSAELQRRYAAEYASMLHAIGDRELARDAARLNLSALVLGQPRIVPSGDDRFTVERLRDVFARCGENLDAVRRAVARFPERGRPKLPMLPRLGTRDIERER